MTGLDSTVLTSELDEYKEELELISAELENLANLKLDKLQHLFSHVQLLEQVFNEDGYLQFGSFVFCKKCGLQQYNQAEAFYNSQNNNAPALPEVFMFVKPKRTSAVNNIFRSGTLRIL